MLESPPAYSAFLEPSADCTLMPADITPLDASFAITSLIPANPFSLSGAALSFILSKLS